MEEQKVAFAEVVRIAKELDVPFIVHTPTPKNVLPFGRPPGLKLPQDRYKRH